MYSITRTPSLTLAVSPLYSPALYAAHLLSPHLCSPPTPPLRVPAVSTMTPHSAYPFPNLGIASFATAPNTPPSCLTNSHKPRTQHTHTSRPIKHKRWRQTLTISLDPTVITDVNTLANSLSAFAISAPPNPNSILKSVKGRRQTPHPGRLVWLDDSDIEAMPESPRARPSHSIL